MHVHDTTNSGSGSEGKYGDPATAKKGKGNVLSSVEWARWARLALSPPQMLLPNGDIDQNFFRPHEVVEEVKCSRKAREQVQTCKILQPPRSGKLMVTKKVPNAERHSASQQSTPRPLPDVNGCSQLIRAEAAFQQTLDAGGLPSRAEADEIKLTKDTKPSCAAEATARHHDVCLVPWVRSSGRSRAKRFKRASLLVA